MPGVRLNLEAQLLRIAADLHWVARVAGRENFGGACIPPAVYHLIALHGLRRGEAAGLRWCDIDLDNRTAVISQQLQQHGGRLEITPPKPRSTA